MSRGIKTIGTFNSESSDHIDAHANDPRRASIAITGIEQAVMMGIKATFE